MLPILLLAAAVPAAPTAAAAERDFARAAQTDGQWTAFRRYATEDATMFAPQPVKTQAFLKDRRDPKVAIAWWAADSYVSCDRGHAANTGPWFIAAQRVSGYFSTIWAKQDDGGWKWLVDGGDSLTAARPAGDGPRIHKAACTGHPNDVVAVRFANGETGEGLSADRTLAWRWHVAPDGARSFDVWLWDGRRMLSVIADRIAAPPPAS
jgi:hypothetical protein